MLKHEPSRIEPKRRNVLDHRKKQFADPQYREAQYPTRLNFYTDSPTSDITLEQFEQWAIDRLHVLAELEACSFRNRSSAETALHMKSIMEKYMPLEANSSSSTKLAAQRKKDHYSHFILRLAFASTEDLRRRFVRVETMLFRLRFGDDDTRERATFIRGLNLDWEMVSDEEKSSLATELAAVSASSFGGQRKQQAVIEEESWCKVDWMRVPELVEGRRVFLKAGKAYVPSKEQASMVATEFSGRLERALELTARALPRLDEDDRLTPILDHLSKNFVTPDASFSGADGNNSGAEINARSIDTLAPAHFPLCMQNLHRSLRRDAHLKHYGRLQYTLFLKGIGLNLEESLLFWRQGFHKITDDTFNKEYRYNVRHAYGEVGGDMNRRGGGYSPFSCQKILTEHTPGTGDAHGCPYRHFSMENLTTFLQGVGINDRAVLQGVKEDKDKQKFHMACNRVFEHVHKNELRRAKDESVMTAAQLETIVHPNEYFKRSYLLKSLGKSTTGDVRMEG
ncbi:DNA primase large subunit [Grosmannia clavigera kw1407]|uniref:DNA primase large subunit n=1 Tax=Grosmannia clavigera (strain kw1407 / UAMH 11150) TaxID=655863 RepID=F0XMF6_GROCL|nr:DNA primase large subunit [Grosmannia clavigera kw1407]EFX01161.1 DNA primase large subunit [Grosmannia clavigera kw1407]